MGIKKVASPVNKAKNLFLKWLKDREATYIEEFEGENDGEWDYYRHVDGFIGDRLYVACFHVWRGKVSIDYSDEENRYNGMSVEEFLQLIS